MSFFATGGQNPFFNPFGGSGTGSSDQRMVFSNVMNQNPSSPSTTVSSSGSVFASYASSSNDKRSVFPNSLSLNSTQSSNFGRGQRTYFPTSSHLRNPSFGTTTPLERNLPNEIEIDDVDDGDEIPPSVQTEEYWEEPQSYTSTVRLRRSHWIRGQRGKGGRQEQSHWIRGQRGGHSLGPGIIRRTSRNVRFFVPSQQNEEYEDEIDKTEPVDNEYEDEDEYGLDQKPSQMVDPTNTTLFFKSLPEELLDYKMFQRWIRSAGVEPDKINLNSNAYFAHVRFKTHEDAAIAKHELKRLRLSDGTTIPIKIFWATNPTAIDKDVQDSIQRSPSFSQRTSVLAKSEQIYGVIPEEEEFEPTDQIEHKKVKTNVEDEEVVDSSNPNENSDNEEKDNEHNVTYGDNNEEPENMTFNTKKKASTLKKKKGMLNTNRKEIDSTQTNTKQTNRVVFHLPEPGVTQPKKEKSSSQSTTQPIAKSSKVKSNSEPQSTTTTTTNVPKITTKKQQPKPTDSSQPTTTTTTNVPKITTKKQQPKPTDSSQPTTTTTTTQHQVTEKTKKAKPSLFEVAQKRLAQKKQETGTISTKTKFSQESESKSKSTDESEIRTKSKMKSETQSTDLEVDNIQQRDKKTKVKNVESKQRKKSQIKTRDETHDDTYELQSQQMLHPMSSQAISEPYEQRPEDSEPKSDTTELQNSTKIEGTCMDMCPYEERIERMNTRRLDFFEMEPGTENDEIPQVNHEWAVKEYRRPSVREDRKEQSPSELRPDHVLVRTMDHLVNNILDRKDVPFLRIHNFIRDRTRAIRQDYTVQGIVTLSSVTTHERIARFHILSEHLLCEENEADFSSDQNMEQLNKTLITCCELYDIMRQKGIHCPNEPEFNAYLLLILREEHDVIQLIRAMTPNVFHSQEVQFAIQVLIAKKENDYYKFFRLVQEADYLTACLMHRFFGTVRQRALETMNKVYRGSFPLKKLTELLCFEDIDEAREFCDHHSLPTNDDEINFHSKTFVLPSDRFPRRVSHRIIEPKRFGLPLREIVNNPPKQLKNTFKSVPREPNHDRKEKSEFTYEQEKENETQIEEFSDRNRNIDHKQLSLTSTPLLPPKTPIITTPITTTITTPTMPTQPPPPPPPPPPLTTTTTPTIIKPTPFIVEPSTSQTSENIRDKRTSGEVFTLSSVPKTSEKTTIPSEPKPQQNNHQIPDIQKPQQLPSNLRIDFEVPRDNVDFTRSPLWTVTPSFEKSTEISGHSTQTMSSFSNIYNITPQRQENKDIVPLKSPAVPHERTQAERKSDKKRLIEERLQQFITKRNKRLMRKFLRLWYLWYRKIKTRKLQEQRERQQREAEYQKFIQSLDTNVIVPIGLRTPSETISQIFASKFQGREDQSSNSLKPSLSSPFEIIEKEKNFRQYLRQLRLKSEYRRKLSWQPLDIPALIYPILKKKNSVQSHLFWKVMLIIPETNPTFNWVESSTDNRSVDIFVDWLLAKFSKGGILSATFTENERKRTTENFTLLSLYKVHARDIEVDESETSYYENSDDQGNILSEEQDKTTLRVCVKLFQNQIFDVEEQELNYHLKGTHVLLLYLPHPRDRGPEEYWQEQRRFLHQLLNSMHPFSSAPLLILFRPEHFTNKEIDPLVIQHLAVLIKNNLRLDKISTERICAFQILPFSNNFEKCEEMLSQGVRWLASQTARQPPLYTYVLKDLIERRIEEILDELVSNYNSHLMARMTMTHNHDSNIHSEASPPLPNVYITKFNDFLYELHKQLTSEKNIRVSYWPIPEFIKHDDDPFIQERMPPENWNTKHYLISLEEALRSLYLPKFPVKELPQSPEEIVQSCLQYLKMMSFNNSNTLESDQSHDETSQLKRDKTEMSHLHVKFIPLADQIQTFLVQYFGSENNSDSDQTLFPWHKIFERIFYYRLSLIELDADSENTFKVAFVSKPPKFYSPRQVIPPPEKSSLLWTILKRNLNFKKSKKKAKKFIHPTTESNTDKVHQDKVKRKSPRVGMTATEQSLDEKMCDEGESILQTGSLDPQIESLLQEIENEKSKAKRLNQLIDEKLETASTFAQTQSESIKNEEQQIDISGFSGKDSRKRKPIREVKPSKKKTKQRKLNSLSS